MITQNIINWFTDVVVSLLELLPPLPAGVASALAEAPGTVATIVGYGDKFSFALPWAQFVAAAGIFVAAVVVGVTIRLTRLVISHLTGGGGSL